MCELYNSLEPAKKHSIAEDLDRTPNEVLLCLHFYERLSSPQVAKKLEDLRTRYAF